jgi:uncharacterized membrane protein YwaF
MSNIYQDLSFKLSQQEKLRKRFLNFLDSSISFFIVSPLVVGFWRGTWDLIVHFHEKYGIFPRWPSLLVAVLFNFTIYALRDWLTVEVYASKSGEEKIEKTMKSRIVYRIYHYLFACSSIMIWRSLWDVFSMGERMCLIDVFLLKAIE